MHDDLDFQRSSLGEPGNDRSIPELNNSFQVSSNPKELKESDKALPTVQEKSMDMTEHSQRLAFTGGKEVFAPSEGPFEAPATQKISGSLYMEAEEIEPALAENESDLDTIGGKKNSLEDSFLKADIGRRDFLRLFGTGAAASVGAAACVRRPAETAIPFVNQPLDTVPGRPVHYASTCGECSAACGVHVKTREGRAVKIEGNSFSALSGGALCALGQGSIQALYHPERRSDPMEKSGSGFAKTTWDDAFKKIAGEISVGKKVAIFTGPSTGNRHTFFKEFLTKIGASENNLYTYDANPLLASLAAAYKMAFGRSAIARPDLRKAQTIIGIGSDFLDVGYSPVYFHKGYGISQNVTQMGTKGEHIHFESYLTLTGAKASERHVIAPGTELAVTLMLIEELLNSENVKGKESDREIARKLISKYKNNAPDAQDIESLRPAIKKTAERALRTSATAIMCGSTGNFDHNGFQLQLAAIVANCLVGSFDNVLELANGWFTPPVVPGDLARFINDAPNYDVVFFVDTNPFFTVPQKTGFHEAAAKLKTIVSIQAFPNETDLAATITLPGHHYLEAWGDESPVAGYWSFRQPAVRPTSGSRQAEDMLMWIAAHVSAPMGFENYQAYLKDKWQAVYKLLEDKKITYDIFVTLALRKGVFGKPDRVANSDMIDFVDSFNYTKAARGLILAAPFDVRLRDGRGAHIPILQEAGDSLTTVAWDTYIALNPGFAKNLGLRRNDHIKISAASGAEAVQSGLYPLPGLHPNVVVIPRGNGKAKGISKITDDLGVDPLVLVGGEIEPQTGMPITAGNVIKISQVGGKFVLAAMQKHNDLANRKDIVKTVTLEEVKQNASKQVELDKVPDLYPALVQGAYRWGMSIDLAKCTGCSACMVACSIENNIPQIGREQVIKGREMHWIRLDRYFEGPIDNPQVYFQPMMCQHCNHAPCEAVCPVYATTHDPEGINAMTYNRCVGTRYCANACPYKVRRFNWFTHAWNTMGERPMDRNPRALNPDVTVRTRGVMEKCNFCYQRIRAAKHEVEYLNQGEGGLKDGQIQTACQQTCPADAITFGDLSKDQSWVARNRKDSRAYLALGGDPEHKEYGLKTLPNVSYLAKVVNEKLKGSEPEHH